MAWCSGVFFWVRGESFGFRCLSLPNLCPQAVYHIRISFRLSAVLSQPQHLRLSIISNGCDNKSTWRRFASRRERVSVRVRARSIPEEAFARNKYDNLKEAAQDQYNRSQSPFLSPEQAIGMQTSKGYESAAKDIKDAASDATDVAAEHLAETAKAASQEVADYLTRGM